MKKQELEQLAHEVADHYGATVRCQTQVIGQESKQLADAALRHILVGRNINGIHFYGSPILVIDDNTYITIESRWEVLDERPTEWPRYSPDPPERPMKDLAAAACSLRPYAISAACVAYPVPHLLLEFDNSEILVVNGHHEQYECWEVTMGRGFDLVAAPRDHLAIWVPEGFSTRD